MNDYYFNLILFIPSFGPALAGQLDIVLLGYIIGIEAF